MVDNSNSGDPGNADQPDFKALFTAFQQQMEQKMADMSNSFKKDMEIQANKIHSSYAGKLKKLGISDDDEAPAAKGSKREQELEALLRESNDNIKKMMDRDVEKDKLIEQKETEKLLLSHKNSVTSELLKNGMNPVQAEAYYKLQQVDGAFVPDGNGSFNWKVKANGIDVALPVGEAIKHAMKSELAQTFLPPKTSGGGTKIPNATDSNRQAPAQRQNMQVDWAAVNKDMHGGSGDGTTAPPFDTSKRY